MNTLLHSVLTIQTLFLKYGSLLFQYRTRVASKPWASRLTHIIIFNFRFHIYTVIRFCCYPFTSFRHILSFVVLEIAKAVAFSIISSKLDHFNITLYGISKCNLSHLPRVHCATARIVLQPEFISNTAALKSPHRYPIIFGYSITYSILHLQCS